MLHPSYNLQIGSASIDPDTSDDLISLRVSLDMDRAADCLDCSLRIRDAGFNLRKDDPISVSLGYKDNLTDIFKGVVDFLDLDSDEGRVFGLNSISKLLRLRVDRFYERQSCGAIVRDLAGAANVSVGDVQNGIQLPYYAIDDNKNAYEHVRELAERCGFEVYVTSDDKFAFKKYQSSSPKIFEYAKNIIGVSRFDQDLIVEKVRVLGESPSSSKGADTAHWLTKKVVQGAAGSGTELLVQDRAVRTTDAASSVARARLDKMRKAVEIMLDVVGDATVMLNDTVSIQEMPESSLNGAYQVRGVEHYLSKSRGFTSSLRLRGEPNP
jgi:phage protein D